jgi:predicted nucleotidyltransferase
MTHADTTSRPDDPILAEIVDRLVAALSPERIYLFGSRARGDAGTESDYDIMVVVARSDLPAHQRDLLAYRALRGLGVAKDVMVWTAQEFDDRVQVPSSLPATILREGRQLHVA